VKTSGMRGRLLNRRAATLLMGSVFAGLTADYRRRLRRDTRRLRLLADVAQVAYIGQRAPDIAQAIADLLVPELVDLCVIDVVGGDGKLQRLGGALNGEPELLRTFLARPPSVPGTHGTSASALMPGSVAHLHRIDDALRRQAAHDEEDFRLLQRLAVESAVTVPLVGREQPIGVMILGTRAPRGRLTGDDVEFTRTLAGRVALALDNAALSQELSSTERQLEVILEAVDAAITVRDTYGRMVYANQAAADLLKLPDPEVVKVQPPGQLMDRFDVYTEAGDPVDLADLPGTRLLAGEVSPPPLVVRNVVKETGEERWLLNRATAVTDAQGQVLMAVNLIEDVTVTKRSEIAQRLLATTARQLAEAADLPRTLGAIADAAVPGLADWAGVDLLSPSGEEITTVAISHRDPEKIRLGWHLRSKWPVEPGEPEGMAAVMRTGEPQLIRDISDEMLVLGAQDPEHLAVLRAVGLSSTMIAPIRAGSRILGALSFVSSTSRRFDERDLTLACDLGRQAGIFINNALLHAEQAHIAETLQSGLIPDSLPALDGWQASSAYRASGPNEVGGDFYDIICFEGGWAAVIGDVVGKGPEAAALTALARHTLAAIIESTGDAAHALAVLNGRLRRDDDLGSMCTIAVAVITDDQRATIFSAGHPLPLLGRDGSVSFVGTTSPLLGFLEEIQVIPTQIQTQPGDQLVLYTDGVLDAAGPDDRFGEQRLLETIQRVLKDETESPADSLIAAIDDFLQGDQNDDIAILSLTRSPVAATSAPGAARDAAPR
jgi:GAF domain-containing protein